MDLIKWAKNEVKLKLKDLKQNMVHDDEYKYECKCYKTALKAFIQLCSDKNTHYSDAKFIINTLIDGLPLSWIKGTDDEWEPCVESVVHDYVEYRNTRLPSLFKKVYPDNTIKYMDINRTYGILGDENNIPHSFGLLDRVIDEMFPIILPYYPTDTYYVHYEELLTDKKNGDFDTIYIKYAIVKPENKRIEINRYFKDSDTSEFGWEEISKEEYEERKLVNINK